MGCSASFICSFVIGSDFVHGCYNNDLLIRLTVSQIQIHQQVDLLKVCCAVVSNTWSEAYEIVRSEDGVCLEDCSVLPHIRYDILIFADLAFLYDSIGALNLDETFLIYDTNRFSVFTDALKYEELLGLLSQLDIGYLRAEILYCKLFCLSLVTLFQEVCCLNLC